MRLSSATIPTQNINFKVYDSDSQELLGIADVALPEVTAMSETISGAGVAGEVDMPVLGHIQSMSVTFNWRTLNKEATRLNAPKAHKLDLRGSVQNYDPGSGQKSSYPVKHSVIVIPKTLSLGNLNVGTTADTSSEYELTYIKTLVGNEEVLELDKLNYIYRVHGVDYLESVRRDLGMSG